MAERQRGAFVQAKTAQDTYIRSVASTGKSPADQHRGGEGAPRRRDDRRGRVLGAQGQGPRLTQRDDPGPAHDVPDRGCLRAGWGRQLVRMRFFCTSNSVSLGPPSPAASRAARAGQASRPCRVSRGPGAAARRPGPGLRLRGRRRCGGGGLLPSWAAQRPACRRETRFETLVAVPAMTAVLATPRISPGIGSSSSRVSGDGFDGVQGSDDRLHRDASAGDELAAGTPQGDGERGCPHVLVDEDRRRRLREPARSPPR